MYLELIKSKKINFSKMKKDLMLCLTCKKNVDDKNLIILKIISHIDSVLYNIMEKNKEETITSLTKMINILKKLPKSFFDDCVLIKQQMQYFKDKYKTTKEDEDIIYDNLRIEEEYFKKINTYMDKKQNK